MKFLPTLSALLFSGFVYAAPIHNLVVFGDSLSDNGNLYEVMNHQFPQSPPYFDGRFSNGPVWIEHLAASYFNNPAAHLQNYAYGGAGVSELPEDEELFTLKREVDNYLAANNDKAAEDSLFIVWIGGNNYLGLPSNPDESVSSTIAGIQNSVKKLVEKGAKNIMIINLPDLGGTPAAIEFDAVTAYSYLSTQHNKALETTFAEFKRSNPAVNWMYFNIEDVFKDAITNAPDYGFTNVNGSCYQSNMRETTKKSVMNMVASVRPKVIEDACDGYLFFDLVHPTNIAHQVIANKARMMLDSLGLQIEN